MKKLIILGLTAILFATACAPLQPGFETPAVNVSSFRVLPTNSIVPTFEIGLHVVNPNRTALKLQGLSYNVELEGYRILSGVANQLPLIEAYGEGNILLQAQPDLFSTLSLFSDLMQQPRETFNYALTASLDAGGLWPKIRVAKSGTIALAAAQK